ncbi:peptidyl-alpha-hydroxyglycine alpha-amidating lyase family protein [Chloroflexota bacterium]
MLYGTGKHTYELVEEWAKLPEGWAFGEVGGLSIDWKDRVYVFSRGGHPLMVFDRDGNLLTSWGKKYFSKRPHGCCIGPENSIYCVDDGNHTVSQFTLEGELLKELGIKGRPSDTGYEYGADAYARLASIKRGGPPFNRPTGVALSASGDIYVSDGYANARVHKFSSDGALVLSWGEPGYGPGQFRLPHNIWVDKEERVWVADRENNRIQIFSAQGEFINQWTDLSRPSDIFIDDDGNVYVSEMSRRVSIFTIDGKLLARWGSRQEEDKQTGLFIWPHTLAIDSRGDLYVGEVRRGMEKVDPGSRSVQKFARRI